MRGNGAEFGRGGRGAKAQGKVGVNRKVVCLVGGVMRRDVILAGDLEREGKWNEMK